MHPGWSWPAVQPAESQLPGNDDQLFARATPVAWNDIAQESREPVTGTTTWGQICRVSVEPRDGLAGYSRPFEGSPPIDLLHAVCDALIDRHGPRKECLFAFWDGFGLRVNVDTERTTELGQGAHYLMAGDLRDLSLLYQNVKRDAFEFANEIPQAVWPLDHSWFFTSPFYIDSTFLAGPLALIEAVTREAGIESYEIHADDEMDFTS